MKATDMMKFKNIYGAFKSNTHTYKDVSEIISLICYGSVEMSDNAIAVMLQIPLEAFKIAQISSQDFMNHGSYFYGNTRESEPWKKLYKAGEYDLSTIIEQYEYVLENKDYKGFSIRNAEVVLRDDVCPRNNNEFEKCGFMFAYIMEQAFEK